MRKALAPLSHTLNLGTPVSYRGNTKIFGEKEPADYAYRVISGSVRTYKILNDGRRQIGGFHLPGDIFGLLEFGDEHTFSADAITDTRVLVVKRKTTRQDIADYLGLTIETVSRTLTVLEGADAIEFSTSRRVVLRNRSALKRLNS